MKKTRKQTDICSISSTLGVNTNKTNIYNTKIVTQTRFRIKIQTKGISRNIGAALRC